MSQTEKAKQFAMQAHGEQLYGDQAYAEHLRRVSYQARELSQEYEVDPDLTGAVGWLHDCLEDTTTTAENLLSSGFDPRVVDAVVLLSHEKGEERSIYLKKISQNLLALIVKSADNNDNANKERNDKLARVEPERAQRLRNKYARERVTIDEYLAKYIKVQATPVQVHSKTNRSIRKEGGVVSEPRAHDFI